MEGNILPLLQQDRTEAVLVRYPMYDDPFAYVEGLSPLTMHQYYYIEKLINQNWITDRDLLIVKTLFVHRWLTFTQICKLFFEDNEPATVRKRIKKLLKHGLIRTITWRSHSKSKAACPSLYELGASGADILNNKYGVRVGSRDPRHGKATKLHYKFKYVLANELYIQLSRELHLMHFEFTPVFRMGEEVQTPTAKFILRTPGGTDLPFILICHRDEEKWMKTLRYQVEFYKSYMNETGEQFILVILVSDEKKAEIANKIVRTEGFGETTWFVTDNDLFSPDHSLSKNSFFEITDGVKQYFDLS
ncbi:replication-relaxation family protein [Paenibacillus polymyxa]|uniref:replication-relaxation family protein n=1 Tax=Paenibacillus polymyxa TaxID=1406 RepID=UPI0023F86A99|nr:replication-relaxation family protein [Paenibacillus polymyxa]